MAFKFSLALAVLAIWAVLQAQGAHHHRHNTTAAPSPSSVDCSSIIFDMADCLSFVSSDGTAEKPEGSCCSGLKTVLNTDADCICDVFKNSASLGITLNMNKAMSLPAACKVQAPPISQCGISLTPTGAPVPASVPAPAPAPATAPGPASAPGMAPTAAAPSFPTGGNEQAAAPAPASTASALFSFSFVSLLAVHLVIAFVSCF